MQWHSKRLTCPADKLAGLFDPLKSMQMPSQGWTQRRLIKDWFFDAFISCWLLSYLVCVIVFGLFFLASFLDHMLQASTNKKPDPVKKASVSDLALTRFFARIQQDLFYPQIKWGGYITPRFGKRISIGFTKGIARVASSNGQTNQFGTTQPVLPV